MIINQTDLIVKGLTIKELDSIQHFQRHFVEGKLLKDNKIELKTIENINQIPTRKKLICKEKLINLLKFLTKSIDVSLIFEDLNE